MKNKSFVFIWVLIFIGASVFLLSFQESDTKVSLDPEAIETYLQEAEVISVEESASGRTSPWIVCLDDGRLKNRGFFKHVNRPRPERLPDSYQYELAAYGLSKLLGLNIVPPNVEREIKGIRGSLSLFMEDCENLISQTRRNIPPPDPEKFKNTMDEILILEILACDQCRDEKDILVKMDTWDLYRIDFSEAFAPETKLNPDCPITRCSEDLYNNLLKTTDEILESKLSEFLNNEEIKALKRRKKLIVKHLKKLIKKHGEQTVLYE